MHTADPDGQSGPQHYTPKCLGCGGFISCLFERGPLNGMYQIPPYAELSVLGWEWLEGRAMV